MEARAKGRGLGKDVRERISDSLRCKHLFLSFCHYIPFWVMVLDKFFFIFYPKSIN